MSAPSPPTSRAWVGGDPSAAGQIVAPEDDSRLTNGGRFAFLIGVSLFLSALPEARLNVAGLSVHPYLLLAAVALPVVIFDQRARPNWQLVAPTIAFGVALFLSGFPALSSVHGSHQIAIWVKWISSGLTFIVGATIVKTRKDYYAGTFGLVVGVSLMGLRGLSQWSASDSYYINVLDGIGSRNTYSLWSAGPFLLALAIATSKRTPKWVRYVSLASAVLISVPQVLSLSRSGWVALGLAAGCVLFFRRSFRAMLFASLVAATLSLAVSSYGVSTRLEQRASDLREGTDSDRFRYRILEAGLVILGEQPILGTSQAELPWELSHHVRVPMKVDSHNLVVEIVAGTGMLGALTFCWLLWSLSRPWFRSVFERRYDREWIDLLVDVPLGLVLLVLLVRSLTGNEIVYNPAGVLSLAFCYRMQSLLTTGGAPAEGPSPGRTPRLVE